MRRTCARFRAGCLVIRESDELPYGTQQILQYEPAEQKEQGSCANTRKLHECSLSSGDAPP